jgi:DhnA family fructose-bisphosphate aldolase class Ia
LARNAEYFDPKTIAELAIGDECRAIASGEADDLAQAVHTAVINKGVGGTVLIAGRRSFRRPGAEGVEIIGAVRRPPGPDGHRRLEGLNQETAGTPLR